MRIAVPLAMVALLAGCSPLKELPHMPRMRQQPSLRPHERLLPPVPAQSVPVQGATALPSEEEAAVLVNPLPVTDDALARGKLYYGYYCQMCHGDDGRGHTRVGESLDLAPTDLSSAELQAKSDGELYRGMMAGLDRPEVMQATVPEERRWLIVHHVRTLGR